MEETTLEQDKQRILELERIMAKNAAELHSLRVKHKTFPADNIVRHVNSALKDLHGLTIAYINSKGKEEAIADMRRIAMAYMSEVQGMTDKAVGDVFNRDRTSVIHACHKHENMIATDKYYLRKYNDFVATVNRYING